jgi:hypothetical protein
MLFALSFPLGFVLVPTVLVVDMFIILVYEVAALITRMIIPCLASLIFPFVSNPFTRCRDEILAMDVKEENATGLNLR